MPRKQAKDKKTEFESLWVHGNDCLGWYENNGFTHRCRVCAKIYKDKGDEFSDLADDAYATEVDK